MKPLPPELYFYSIKYFVYYGITILDKLRNNSEQVCASF